MSHFTVLVVGANPDAQLEPFHEYECTGRLDKYVVEIDKTAEARQEFDKETVLMIRLPDGSFVSPFTPEGAYDPAHWNNVEEHKNNHRVEVTPKGDHQRVPAKEHVPFLTWLKSYYGDLPVLVEGSTTPSAEETPWGYFLVNSKDEVLKVVRRTNPNAKWDGYQVGGRWNGFFKLKDGFSGVLGAPGVFGNKAPLVGRADSAIKGAIDFEGMRGDRVKKVTEHYERIYAIVGPYMPEFKDFVTIRKECGFVEKSWRDLSDDEKQKNNVAVEQAREVYHEQLAVKALREAHGDYGRSDENPYAFVELDDMTCSLEAYQKRAHDEAICTFALLKDGKWYERGNMGWWGVVSDEKDKGVWSAEFSKMLDELPDETLLTVVDCHI